jgi:hypothetical protein
MSYSTEIISALKLFSGVSSKTLFYTSNLWLFSEVGG